MGANPDQAVLARIATNMRDLKLRADNEVLTGTIAYPIAAICVIFAFCVGRILRHSGCGGFTCSCRNCEVSAVAFS